MTANIDTAARELDRDGYLRLDELLTSVELGGKSDNVRINRNERTR